MSNKLIKLFGLPETAEKLGLFRLRLCEIFSLGVFWALKSCKCILNLKRAIKLIKLFGLPETAEKLGLFRLCLLRYFSRCFLGTKMFKFILTLKRVIEYFRKLFSWPT